MKYWLETYGCQMNKAESNALEIQLSQKGWLTAQDPEEADLIILNTCSVRKTAENRIWGRLAFFDSLKNNRIKAGKTHVTQIASRASGTLKIAIMGCMSERLKEELYAEYDYIDIVISNNEKDGFVSALEDIMSQSKRVLLNDKKEYSFLKSHYINGFKAFPPIMHGCNNFCSYCIVPHVRGPEKSRPIEDIMTELYRMEEEGVKEVILVGRNVNSYFYSPFSSPSPAQSPGEYNGSANSGNGIDFSGLLLAISEKIKNIPWIRFLTSHPKDLSPSIIKMMRSNPCFCKHIHLPVQHGSDRILHAMNRKYTSQQYLNLLENIYNTIIDISITTDILIGFPGETEQDYQDTINLMRAAQFNDAFTYKYNAIEGTAAFSYTMQVPEEVKTKRLQGIIDLQRGISRMKKEGALGRKYRVLIEDISRKAENEYLGRTEHDDMVVFPAADVSSAQKEVINSSQAAVPLREDQDMRIGQMTVVEINSLKGNTLWGREVQ